MTKIATQAMMIQVVTLKPVRPAPTPLLIFRHRIGFPHWGYSVRSFCLRYPSQACSDAGRPPGHMVYGVQGGILSSPIARVMESGDDTLSHELVTKNLFRIDHGPRIT